MDLLEDEPIQVLVPKAYYAENAYWAKDTPIFATSKFRTKKHERGQIDEVDTEMMESRWNVFVFCHQFTANTIVDIQPCSRYFTTLVLGE